MLTPDDHEAWNEAVGRLTAIVGGDAALQSFGVDTEPRVGMVVVIEPERELSATSRDAIAEAQRSIPVRVITATSTKAELDAVRDAVEAAAQHVDWRGLQRGLAVGTDYARGVVTIRGNLDSAQALASTSGVDPALLAIEHQVWSRGPRRVSRG